MPVTASDVDEEEVNRSLTSLAACWFNPRCRTKPVTVDCPTSAFATITKGKKHNSSTAAKSIPLLMKSSELSRFHRCAAEEPV